MSDSVRYAQHLGNRQERKQNMRGNILPEMGEEEIQNANRALRAREAKRMGLAVVVVLLLLLAFFVYRLIRGLRAYTSYSVVWDNEDLGSNTAGYTEMNGAFLRTTMDGITCLNTDGDVLWNYGYNMRNPRIETQGDYGVVADIQYETAIIFNKDGVVGDISTNKSILNASISSHGVVALVLDDDAANYINFYDNMGNQLDIEIKTILSGDGYPMDISLSPSGTGLASSVVFLDQSQMQNQITFYNFDVGKTESNRVVGYFNCGDIMYPQVSYLTDSTVCAFGDSQIDLYSLKNESKPALIASLPFENQISSVFSCQSLIGVVTQTDGANRLLQVYDLSGSKKFEREVDFEYTTAAFSGSHVVLYNGTECMILSSSGRLRYQGTLDSNIRGLIMLDDHNCLVMGSASTRKIRFR